MLTSSRKRATSIISQRWRESRRHGRHHQHQHHPPPLSSSTALPSLSASSLLSDSHSNSDGEQSRRLDEVALLPRVFNRSSAYLDDFCQHQQDALVNLSSVSSSSTWSSRASRVVMEELAHESSSTASSGTNQHPEMKQMENMLVTILTDMYLCEGVQTPEKRVSTPANRTISTSNHGMTPLVLNQRSTMASHRLFMAQQQQQHQFSSSSSVTRRFLSTAKASATSDEAKKEETSSSSSETSKAPQEAVATSVVEKKSVPQQVRDAILGATKAILSFVMKLPGWTFFYLTHPTELRKELNNLWEMAKKEAQHYWVGTKLLIADVQTATQLIQQMLTGSVLTRRERKQLLRTVSDLFRLVPFSMFILIPFMEFALPFALRLFPNMLPSTFQDSLKAEETMKRELQSRIAMAQFFQDTLQEMAKEQKKKAAKKRETLDVPEGEEGEDCIDTKREESAVSFLDFLEKARSGEGLPPDAIIQYANYFHDDLTLDNMPRMQLVNMCKYMNIAPYGSNAFLQFQLRHRIRTLKEDDQRILWEGIDSLTKMELREACQERGMRSTGLSKDSYKQSLQQWLDLSVNKNVPIMLLIMSRAFFLREETFTRVPTSDDDGSKSLAALSDAISGLDKDVVNEVVLQVATDEEKKSDPSVTRIKLEVLEAQNERIEEEKAEREAATKKKEEKEKEHKEEELATALESSSVEVSIETSTDKTQTVAEVQTDATDTVKSAEATAEAESEEDDDEPELSSSEIEAISQLVSPDPVTKERQELERLKASMKDDEEDVIPDEVTDAVDEAAPKIPEIDTAPLESITAESSDEDIKKALAEMDRKADLVAKASTTTSLDAEKEAKETKAAAAEVAAVAADTETGDENLDKAISRLKSRVSSMVEKIESQMAKVESSIGDKLHFLDKDMDGILTQEEMAQALQKVLKRDLSFEDAMEIAALMDENKDGVFTMAELIDWIETNKIVKLLEEGRDADVDRLLESQKTEGAKDEEQQKEAAS